MKRKRARARLLTLPRCSQGQRDLAVQAITTMRCRVSSILLESYDSGGCSVK